METQPPAAGGRSALYLAVDGGGSKTDAALFDQTGRLLAFERAGTISPYFLGAQSAARSLSQCWSRLAADAGLANRDLAGVALSMHGLDFPEDEADYTAAVTGLAPLMVIGNDMTGLLRSGVPDGWGIAVGCGSGSNAIGRDRDGRTARFIAFGPISGDFGGGFDLATAAVGAACRMEDGRGADTALHQIVCQTFGIDSARAVVQAIAKGRLERDRLLELVPGILRLADADAAAGHLVDHLAQDLAEFVVGAANQLGLDPAMPIPVTYGGGVFQSGTRRLIDRFGERVRRDLPNAAIAAPFTSPVGGAAALLADAADLGTEATNRITTALTVAQIRRLTR